MQLPQISQPSLRGYEVTSKLNKGVLAAQDSLPTQELLIDRPPVLMSRLPIFGGRCRFEFRCQCTREVSFLGTRLCIRRECGPTIICS